MRINTNPEVRTRDEIRADMQKAFKTNDTEGFYRALDEMMTCIGQELQQQYDQQAEEHRQALEAMQEEMDSKVLSARGVRQLTSAERGYYQKLAAAMKSSDPRQAVTGLADALPSTTINSVFQELQTAHPLLSRINFHYTGGAVEIMVNANGYEEAVWGDLCDEIVKELTAALKKVKTNLLKLSAFLPVCKAMLELGPEWLDDFVRQTLYEALSNGMEAGFVDGNGKSQPIGMTRQVGNDVVVVGGEYPRKAAIKVNDLTSGTVGNLVSLMAADPNGKPRRVQDVILLVNPQDYFSKVMPATTVMAPDGTYRNDVMPYPMSIIQTPALSRGQAVIGVAYRYLALAGTSPEGRIEYSDHYRFLEDERVYLIKAYANGMPLDNNAFLLLDISGLEPATYKVTMVEPSAPSTNADLAALSLGSLALDPTFVPTTTTYTATTTNATNTINAVPADAAAAFQVLVGDEEIANGSAATWKAGSNTVTVNVTAPDGKTKKAYTVTVTKSGG